MPKAWTRNQKLTLTAIIVTAVLGLFGALGTWLTKVQLQVKHVRNEIHELKVTAMEVEQLKSKLAEIETINTTAIGVGTKSPKAGVHVQGEIAAGKFTTLNTNLSGSLQLFTKDGAGWEITITGKSLAFLQLENGRWVPRHTLSSTGFVSKP